MGLDFPWPISTLEFIRNLGLILQLCEVFTCKNLEGFLCEFFGRSSNFGGGEFPISGHLLIVSYGGEGRRRIHKIRPNVIHNDWGSLDIYLGMRVKDGRGQANGEGFGIFARPDLSIGN
ncbi:hypothetical protein HAX54_008528 [Datura stramonium]|uniref:Uncharacterized protein n=1 Tax=Datura stramonium TaxID=4076 RepID=A0ABS8TEW9_DATST|nr:hypothetical protein [Datura stramonium]